MTAVTGTYTEGATSGTSHSFTVPTGVVSGMKAIIVVATGSSASQSDITLSKSGATFSRVELIQATNQWAAVFEGTGLVAGDQVTVTLAASATVSIGHYYTDEWDPVATIGTGGTRGGVSGNTTTSGSLSVTAGQRVFVVATERTTTATTVTSVVSSGGEAVTQISFGEGSTVQTSVFLGYFTAGSTGSRTVTITYSNSSGNAYCGLWAATVLGGGGPPPTSYLPTDILRITATAGGNNYFNVGIGKTSGHVDVWPDTIAGGYNESPYFYAKTNVDGLWVVEFHAPLDGGTTSANTEYARSELRELTQGANSNSSSWRAAWDPKTGDHWIECWSRVTSLPPNKPQVCTIQAHDPDDDTIMILTQKVSGVVTLRLRYKGSDSGLPVLDSNYQVGREFYTKIRLINGRCEVYYYCPATGAGSMTTPISTTTTFSGAASGWYYKAGCYNQSNETIDSSGSFKVEMRDLRHWHTGWTTPLPPWSTTISGTPTVNAGTDASIEAGAVFSRSATETGTITGRQWKIVSGPSGVGTTLSTSGSVNWTPTTQGTYVLGFYGTYSGGTAYDEITVTVTAPTGGGEPTGSIVWDEEFPDGTPYDVITPGTNIVNVSTAAQLTSALSSATAGSRIRLASGTYSGSFTLSAKQGNTGGGISIEAATPGGVTFAAGSSLTITSCREVVISGLSAPWEGTGGNQFLKIGGSSTRIRVTRCTFGPTGSGTPTGSTDTWNYVYAGDQASHLRFDHNTFRRKGTGGNALRVYGDFNTNQGCPYVRIDHNLFIDIGPQTENDKEPVRLGVSAMSRTDSHSVVERNIFANCTSEPETCSIKMGDVRMSGNVFLNCAGSGVSRHGRNNIIADNYWVDTVGVTASGGMRSGGTRFYDSGHLVRNNYMGGLKGTNFQAPLLIDTGDAEGSSTNLAGHWRVIDATVQWNFIVDCATGIQVGDNYSTDPANCVITDNLVSRCTNPAALTYINSTTIGTDADIGRLATDIARNTYAATPDLHGATQDANGIWRKAGYGPRVSYLTVADVGPSGDMGDTDRTGSGIGSGGGSTTSPPVVNIGADVTIEAGKTLVRSATESGSGIFGRTWTLVNTTGSAPAVDPTRAASVLNWGPPHVLSDEFDYGTPGSPVPVNSSKWSVYDGPGHSGNGVRSPDRIRVNGTTMVMTGLGGGANTGGMMHRARSASDFANRGGRWEARCRSYYSDQTPTGFTAHVFVSPTGSDSNNGTSAATPKRTLGAALTLATAGQTISLADGTYPGNFISTKGGSAGNFITIRSATRWGATIVGNSDTPNQTVVELRHQYLRLQDVTVTGPGGEGSGARNGVSMAADNTEVVGCHIHTICQWSTAGTGWQGGAGIDVTGPTGTNLLADGNVINNIGTAPGADQLVHGAYCTAHVTNGRFVNNVIYDCEDFGLHPYDDTENSGWQFINNTVYNCGRGILQAPNGTTRNNIVYNVIGRHYDIRGSGNTGSNNRYSGTGTGPTGASIGATSIASPGFVNAAGGDFHLTSSSGLRDAGTATNAPATDADRQPRQQGSAVDIGAYEYAGALSGGYHPVLLTWPDDDSDWPAGGEYDWLENGEPGEQAADGFLHYPSLNGSDSQIDLPGFPVDMTQFFNVAFEWTKDGLRGWINGQPWYGPLSGGANSSRKALQDMTVGRGTIQLDAFQASPIASVFEVEWFRFYELTAAGSEAPTPVVDQELATGTGTLTWVAPATLGTYRIRYAAENAYGIGTDELTVTVVAPGGTQPEPGQESPPVFVGAGAGQSGKQATVDPTPAPGATAGDFEICAIISAGDETISTVPSGWLLLDSALVTSPGGTDPVDRGGPSRCWLYYTTTQGGQAAAFGKSGTRFMHAVRAAWRGHSSLGEHGVTVEAINTADLVHAVAPVAAVRDKSLAVGLIMADLLNQPAGPFQSPAGWTARYDSTKVSQTENESIAIADALVAPGTVRGDFASTNPDETAVFTFILEGPNVQNFSKSTSDTATTVETATVTILDAGTPTSKAGSDVVSTVETETLRVFLDASDASQSVDTPGAGVVGAGTATIEWVPADVVAGKVYPLIVDAAPSVQWYALDPPLAVDLVETALIRWTALDVTGGKSGSIITPLPLPPERTRPRLLAQSIIDGRWLSMELPVNDPEVTWALSGATTITGSFAPEMSSIADLGLEPWGTWIYLEEDEEIRAAGILQPVQIEPDGRMTLSAVGPHAYAKRVPYRARYSGIGIDPADAVRVMWDHIQAFPRGDLGVTIEGSTPVTIGTPPREVEFVTGEGEEVSFTAGPYTLDYWQNTLIGNEIEKLGADTPFDFIERAAWRDANRNDVQKWIVIHYPSAGWRRTDLRFAQGENVIEYAPVEEPADAYADVVYVQGKGEGIDKIGAEAEAVVGNRVRLPAIVDDKTIDSVQRAQKVAKDELAARLASLVEVPEIVCDARHRNAPLGSFVPGDDILVQVIYPYVGVISAWHRILTIKYVPWQNRMVLALTRRGEFRQ